MIWYGMGGGMRAAVTEHLWRISQACRGESDIRLKARGDPCHRGEGSGNDGSQSRQLICRANHFHCFSAFSVGTNIPVVMQPPLFNWGCKLYHHIAQSLHTSGNSWNGMLWTSSVAECNNTMYCFSWGWLSSTLTIDTSLYHSIAHFSLFHPKMKYNNN